MPSEVQAMLDREFPVSPVLTSSDWEKLGGNQRVTIVVVKKPSAPPTAKSVNPVTFLKQVQVELAKVEWPTRKQTVKLTGIVLGASVVVGMYIGGLDTLFTYLLTFLVK